MVVLKDFKETHISTAKTKVGLHNISSRTIRDKYDHEMDTKQKEHLRLRDKRGLKSSTTLDSKQTTHSLATAIREKIINVRHTTSMTLHWVKGHAGLKGNERADYLAKTAASYCAIIAYDKIPINLGKKLLEEH